MNHIHKRNGETSHFPFRYRQAFSPAQRLLNKLYPENSEYQTPDKEFLEINVDWIPILDIIDKKDLLMIEIDLPGVETENISIKLNHNTLWIEGERRNPESGDDTKYFCCERQYGTFARYINLPDSVDLDKVTTEHKNGVLKIAFEKKQSAKPRDIEIKLG